MITVASYNIRKGLGTDRRRRPDRVLDVLHEIGADIVTLQEKPTPQIIMTAAGICADAENTLISGTRFMIDRSRPVLVEASLM